MILRLVVLVALTALAVGIAVLLQRRRPDPPSAPSYRAPSQLDRDDFERPEAPFLLAVFASVTCDTCPRAWAAVQRVASGVGQHVAIQRIDVQDDPDLHQRYRIDGVPTTIVAGPDGVVLQAFFGPVGDEQLTEALLAAGGAAPEGGEDLDGDRSGGTAVDGP